MNKEMWDKAKSGAKKEVGSTLKNMMEEKMQIIKVEKPKKSGNGLSEWSEAQYKPEFSISDKHIDNMPDMPVGKKVMIMMECMVKSCNAKDSGSKDYRLEVEKMGVVE